MRFLALSARGTSATLDEELAELAVPTRERLGTTIACEGSLADAYRVCIGSRVASRVLLPIATFRAQTPEELYEGVSEIPWQDHVDPNRTFAISTVRRGNPPAGNLIESPRFATLKTKDAVVDALRSRCGKRPDIDTKTPDLRIHLLLDGDDATISIDLSGRGLHHRDVARSGGLAPLRENLAAALLRIAGWPQMAQRGGPLVDPMCGSASLLMEAAWMAREVAPGLLRKRHGFEGWLGHDPSLFALVIEEAQARRHAARTRCLSIHGSDASPETIALATRNAMRAGLEDAIRLTVCPLADAKPPAGHASIDPSGDDEPPTGLFITNPPYGARLGESGELLPLYTELGNVLRRRFLGYDAFVLSGNPQLTKEIGLKPRERHAIWNGPIECRFLGIPIAREAVQRDGGPGWRKVSKEGEMLRNRLRKNHRRFRGWAKQHGIHCYRLYDAEIPEYNVAIDVYDGLVYLQEFERPKWIPADRAASHLRDAILVTAEAMGTDPAKVRVGVRRRGAPAVQYEKRGSARQEHEVREGGHRFLVNLDDYLDTGLFLDHRKLRATLGELAPGKDFLNLFAYTCSASVYAAAGGARSTTSVDISPTYLAWGQRNLGLNQLLGSAHRFVESDYLGFLSRDDRSYDLMLVAPPIVSRSHRRSATDFDVQRDHLALLQACRKRLRPGGALYFSTPLSTFAMDREVAQRYEVEDLSEKLRSRDFARRPLHVFRLSPKP